MKKMMNNRYWTIILLAILIVSLLSGCGSKLPKPYDEDEVKAAAGRVINFINQRDVEGLQGLMSEEAKVLLTENYLTDFFALLECSRNLRESGELIITPWRHNSVTYAMVGFEKSSEAIFWGNIQAFEIVFDPDMKLAFLPYDISSLKLVPCTIAENSAIDTYVGTFETYSPNLGDNFHYSLIAGEGDSGNNSFNISGEILLSSQVMDYQTQSSYSIRVRATNERDGQYQDVNFIINVIND